MNSAYLGVTFLVITLVVICLIVLAYYLWNQSTGNPISVNTSKNLSAFAIIVAIIAFILWIWIIYEYATQSNMSDEHHDYTSMKYYNHNLNGDDQVHQSYHDDYVNSTGGMRGMGGMSNYPPIGPGY